MLFVESECNTLKLNGVKVVLISYGVSGSINEGTSNINDYKPIKTEMGGLTMPAISQP